ncbi:MAG: S8/S53 family peptidase [Bacteroidetes bacterium]|nr:S8/S53 family peptidase [Bacteroidota bacterium]
MRLIVLVVFLIGVSASAQEAAWFYFRAKDTSFLPTFKKKGDYLHYTGTDSKLADVLKNYKIQTFKKTWKHAKRENLKKTFFVIADKASLKEDLLKNASHVFEYGERIAEADKKIFEPNDYGLTSTIGENKGAQVNLDYYDFLGVHQAWYYTTGSRDVIIGISDGTIDTLDIEFAGKSKIIRSSQLVDGHGYSVAATAAAQGNNGYGIPGICYDCSIYSTHYSNWDTLEQLVELSRLGAKVINCSWGITRYYQTAQDAIYEMLENGTVVVAIGHNLPFLESQGNVYYYPASYDGVIAVSSATHRYADYRENIKIEMPKNLYYVENIRYYVGRTAGFKDNDTTQLPHLYPVSIKNLNDKIDIVAPSVGLFRYGELALNDTIAMSEFNQTSGVAPLITGTIGLMFSLYPCLPADEVESIIKLTSTNIDAIEANKPYKGLYGAGMLHTGRAVKMVHDMFSEGEVVKIENQFFERWNFKLTSHAPVQMQYQEFTESAQLNLVSKRQIVLGENTVLKPNAEGGMHLKIEPGLKKECELRLRE